MNLSDCFLATAENRSEKVGIYYGDQRLSYGELRGRSLSFARLLRDRYRVQPGDRVGVWLRNRPEFVFALFGALHAGAVVVPINSFFKAEELAYLIGDAGIRVLLSENTLLERLGRAFPENAEPHVLSLEELDLPDTTAPDEFPFPARTREDLAVLVYTSGTTGRPKGAMLSHGNLLHNVESCRQILEVVDLDRFVLMLPMFHSFMLTVCVLLPLLTGGSIVLIKSLQPVKAMLAEMTSNKGSVLPAMAQVFRALAGIPAGVQLPLRLCISGAGPLPAGILHAFNARFPDTPLIEGYGLSEASPVVSVNPIRGPWLPGSIGQPIPDVEVTIQDDEGNILPAGIDGEICVRGGNVMKGYWNAPEKTARVFRGSWLLTGDIGHRRSDGYFVITDRKTDMLKPNGMNVYPREIEEVICQFEGVREAAVIGEPDERRGERPIAFVVPEEGTALDEKALLEFLRERLADYKLPRRTIALSALPRNVTGKVLKTELRDRLREATPA
jgi:long-chain acyl-CoA synthetase